MKKNKKLTNAVFILTVIVMSVYLLWRLFFTLPFGDGWFALVAGGLLLWCEIEAALGTFELFWRKNREFTLEMPDIPADWYPEVDVFIATHNEPVELLYNTANACTFMEYPAPAKVHIYLCDDGNRPEVAALAGQLGIGYLGMAGNKHAKSGNLNNALSKTSAPLVVTFDADMIPRRSFLMKSIPYFFLPWVKKTPEGEWVRRAKNEMKKGYRIGFVQTPQSFYNPDLFQYNLFAERNIPNEQDFFTKEVNVMRNSSNAAAYTGSNTVIARKALQDIGGFPTDTITEDFETGIMIQSHGYTTFATTEVLASGLSPTTISSMISQRVRWARGVIQSIRNCRVPFNKGLTPSARVSYMVNYSYWWSFARRFVFTMAPILFALFGVRVAVCGFWDLLAFWGPSHLMYGISMRMLSSETRNQRWSQIIDTILAPYMILPVILESIGIKQKKFKVTKKTHDEQKASHTLRYALPHVAILGLSAASLLRFISGKYGMAIVYGSIIIFWLTYNVINLLYAIFFMWGRKIYRKTQRFDAAENLRVRYNGRVLETKTLNISEGGLAFTLPRAEYIPDDEPISFVIANQWYVAGFEGVIAYVKQAENKKWVYGVRITAMGEEDRRQYMQIIYDRMHSLPTKIDEWSTAFDDLSKNMDVRMSQQQMDKRKLPRIPLNKQLAFDDGATGLMVDFNYRYAFIKNVGRSPQMRARRYTYTAPGGVRLALEREVQHAAPPKGRKKKAREGRLFRVANWQELVFDPQFAALLDEWTAEYEQEQSLMEKREFSQAALQ